MDVKKQGLIVGGIVLLLLAAGIFAISTVFAQDTPPPKEEVIFIEVFCTKHGEGIARCIGSTGLEAAVESLGMSSEELKSKLKDGMTLEEIAEEAGVDIDKVREAIQASRNNAMRTRIEQALEDGKITQEKADWLLEGLDKGFLTGHGFGFRLWRRELPHIEIIPDA